MFLEWPTAPLDVAIATNKQWGIKMIKYIIVLWLMGSAVFAVETEALEISWTVWEKDGFRYLGVKPGTEIEKIEGCNGTCPAPACNLSRIPLEVNGENAPLEAIPGMANCSTGRCYCH